MSGEEAKALALAEEQAEMAEKFRVLLGNTVEVDCRLLKPPLDIIRVRERDPERVRVIMSDLKKNWQEGHMILGVNSKFHWEIPDERAKLLQR